MKKIKLILAVLMIILLSSCANQKLGTFVPNNIVLSNSNYIIGERYHGIAEQTIFLGLSSNQNGLYYTAYQNLKENASLRKGEAFVNITTDYQGQVLFFGLFTIKTVTIGADVIKFTEPE